MKVVIAVFLAWAVGSWLMFHFLGTEYIIPYALVTMGLAAWGIYHANKLAKAARAARVASEVMPPAVANATTNATTTDRTATTEADRTATFYNATPYHAPDPDHPYHV